MSTLVSLEGKLSKYTNVVKGWQSRYFILSSRHGSLDYHLSESEAKNCSGKPRGSLLLAGAVIAPSIDDEFTFSVNAANGEVYKLRASSTKERQEWVSHLRAISHHFNSQIAQDHPPLSNNRRHQPSIKAHINDNIVKFKDQVQNISSPAFHPSAPKVSSTHNEGSNVDTLSVNSLSQNYAIRPRSESQLSSGNSPKFSESRRSIPKSSLKELQNAREMLVSADNYHAGLVNTLDSLPHQGEVNQKSLNSAIPTEENRHQTPMALDRDVLLMKATSAAMLQSLSAAYTLLHKYHLNTSSALPANAAISWVKPRAPVATSLNSNQPSVDTGNSVASFEVPALANPRDEVKDPPAEVESELGPVDEHKNVIMELLSQIKLGMDLTKVTLPTFILEKRSLLEMYADLLGHTDLFLATAAGATSEERMCRVIKFYLSSFYCGRQGRNAKKPYNPIIGELFQCSYYVPKNKDTSNSDVSSESHYRVQFLSEQVSHHPPVSACFVSCPQQEVSLHSHIWTKSRFMNMTVGVNNIGESTLSLARHQESYVMTYPSVYARSILTVPWSELGGRCSIVCEQTGLSATVTFHTKPTYGGRPDRVTVEAKTGNGFVFCRADGRWNGTVEFTYYKDVNAGESNSNEGKGQMEMFDITQLPVFPKYVLPLEKQSKMESRKLWHHVTEALRKEDLASATKHKEALERQQRQVEAKRKEAQVPISNNYFSMKKGKDHDVYVPIDAVM